MEQIKEEEMKGESKAERELAARKVYTTVSKREKEKNRNRKREMKIFHLICLSFGSNIPSKYSTMGICLRSVLLHLGWFATSTKDPSFLC